MPFNPGHALLIGVGTHQYVPAANVPITVADAQAVSTVLRNTQLCGYPAEQVQVLHDNGATKGGILAALHQLAQQTGKGDTVFFFYCGHGALGTDGNYYLVSHDAQVQGNRVVAGSGVREAELLDKLRKIPAERVLMVFNACYSGNLSPSLDLGAQPLSTSNPPEASAAALLGTGKGRIIITASREDQKSWIGKGELSIFTQALVDGLSGKGVSNNAGYISVFGLYEYLYETVGERANKDCNAQQEPELTVLKGVGPFAVSLYKGASDVGSFSLDEALPQGPAVREVKPEKSARMFNKIIQSGGVNFGQGNEVNIDGDVFGGDKVQGDKIDGRDSQGMVIRPSGSVNQTFGTNIDTGGGAYIGGSVTTGGDFVGRDQFKTGTPDPLKRGSTGQLPDLLKQLRGLVNSANLDDDEKSVVLQNLATVEAQLARPEPKLPIIKGQLDNMRDMIDAAAGAAAIRARVTMLLQQTWAFVQQQYK